ncbi:hypothetical protein FHX81_3246 [Saccharothrix saharensis]|uniref:Uncharacterized protein n=1 Tax=Saccharothrix saharensis TaxID=571190 RepID=A0A543JDG8_9PSEU|nr:hypothetical protein [Saccharothrix saharensis]TQM80895.1 hypothetical protein FHX81_3246 [Saccharothrix saharensis]
MNHEVQRCLQLASLAALPLGIAIGTALSDSPWVPVAVGLGSSFLWSLATLGLVLWHRVRALHRRSGHWVLTAVAVGFPHDRVDLWLEEMRGQLLELAGKARRKYLVNLAMTAGRNWSSAWLARWQHVRAVRFRGEEHLLVHVLGLMLAPDGDRTTAVDLLHAAGLSRLHSRQPSRQVPALMTARRLLSTRSPHLARARELVRDLLATRERAYLITLRLRRDPLAAWLRDHEEPYARQYAELARLRARVQHQAERLRAELHAAAEHRDHQP